jgi:4-amino-4-deoxy-L-arabinose transferase-like glycosyltransferase
MVRSGEWLTPTLDGLPYFHKPPLFYWITAASLSVFGLSEWAARAAPIIGGWVGALSLYLFLRRWASAGAARFTLIALLAQPLFFMGGQFANLDMLVAGCITATVMLLAHAVFSFEQGAPHRSAVIGGWAVAALGVLAKGLIGFVLPGAIVLLWLLLMRRWRAIGALLWSPGPLVFLAVGAPWFLLMQQRFPDFLHYFFVVQHFQRFSGEGFNNAMPFWFYPAVLLAFGAPWWPWLARELGWGARLTSDRGALRLLMALWLGVVTLFFSLPSSKLLGYILPAVPPLMYFIGDGFVSLGAVTAGWRRLWWGGAALGVLVSLVGIVGFALRPPSAASHDLARVLAAQRLGGEPVFMAGRYYFDLPFYAALREPVVVIDNWSNPEIKLRDNWRKELFDAGELAPERAAAVLVETARFGAVLCASPVSWVIGPADYWPTRLPAAAVQVAKVRNHALWRVARPAADDASGADPCAWSALRGGGL